MADRLRSQGYTRAGNLTDLFVDELDNQHLLPETLYPERERIRGEIKARELVFPNPDALREPALGLANEYLALEVSMEDLLAERRDKPVAATRHLVAYLMHGAGNLSYLAVARSLNRKDHTTVMNSLRVVDGWRADPQILADTNKLIGKMRGIISGTPVR